jgi:hypothetical protein
MYSSSLGSIKLTKALHNSTQSYSLLHAPHTQKKRKSYRGGTIQPLSYQPPEKSRLNQGHQHWRMDPLYPLLNSQKHSTIPHKVIPSKSPPVSKKPKLHCGGKVHPYLSNHPGNPGQDSKEWSRHQYEGHI